ncbi:hypothetical protein PENCOP_c011G00126 [Penicillium coprophilum]|uniref:Myb-like domain-containing protein n=1 Tax=Penicillium coprophilum TaxID=36646 RepID=A0A1V6UFL6_9EURO|nr:hypothetical protein PENCOP_c011G00126 [Penicillium coprophilum]
MDMMAIPGVPKSWMTHPTQYNASSDYISAYSSGFGSPGGIDKRLSSSPDWYSFFYPSTSTSHLEFPLQQPSPTIDAQRPRKSHTATMNQPHLPGHPMIPTEGRRYLPIGVEDPRTSAYSQSVSPFTTGFRFNSTLSSNGSTYCESDPESIEQLDDPFVTRNMEVHVGLVHPTPRSSLFTGVGHSFLSDTEETLSFPSLGTSEVPGSEQVLSNTLFNVPSSNVAAYHMGTSFNPHIQHAHLTPSTTPPNGKPVNYEEDYPWPLCESTNVEIWCPTRCSNGLSEHSGWHTHNLYNAYSFPSETNEPAAHGYGMGTGLPMPFYGPALVSLGSSASMNHQSYLPPYVPCLPTVEAPPRYQPTSKPVSPNTELKLSDQKPAKSLSPSSSIPMTDGGHSPQPSGEDQSGIETSLHYSDKRNRFLINCKRRGLSYRDIKRVGGFTEAESTLRGRYRTLTKSKDQRVRKPKWHDKDIQLLCEAVNVHAESHDAYSSLANTSMSINESPKVSWKKVAEHIRGNGGSYHFGNATCKKKWCEINNIPS